MRFLALLAVGLITAAAPEPSFDLLWRPKRDQTIDYALSLNIAVKDHRFQYDTKVHKKVLDVKDNGDYELETSTQGTRIRMGVEAPMALDEEPAPTVETYTSRGERVGEDKVEDEESDQADPVGKILGDVTEFTAPAAPVKQGETWTKDQQDDPRKEQETAHIEYQVVGMDKDVVRVRYQYRERKDLDAVVANGTFRLRRDDFSLVSCDTTVENFKMDDNAPAGTAKLSMHRI